LRKKIIPNNDINVGVRTVELGDNYLDTNMNKTQDYMPIWKTFHFYRYHFFGYKCLQVFCSQLH